MHSFTTGINFAAEFNKLTKTHKPMFKMTLLLSALAVATGVAAQQPATPAGIEKRMPATPELKKTDGVYTFGNQKKPKVSVSELAEKGLQAKEVSKTVMSSRLNRAPFFKEIWENPDYEWKLDSVIGHGPDGDPTRQLQGIEKLCLESGYRRRLAAPEQRGAGMERGQFPDLR